MFEQANGTCMELHIAMSPPLLASAKQELQVVGSATGLIRNQAAIS